MHLRIKVDVFFLLFFLFPTYSYIQAVIKELKNSSIL